MKIMTNLRYEAICEIVTDQKKRLIEKEAEIERLKEQIDNLQTIIKLFQTTMLTVNADNIDFPNSMKGGFEDSNIFLL